MNTNSTKNPLRPIDSQAKAQTLAAVYREILSWPTPREKTEPVAGDLSGDTAIDSDKKAFTNADASL